MRALQASALGVCSDVRFAGRNKLAAGHSHACAVSAAGTIVCWGAGNNYFGTVTLPAVVSSNQIAVTAGDAFSCSLSSAGGVNW